MSASDRSDNPGEGRWRLSGLVQPVLLVPVFLVLLGLTFGSALLNYQVHRENVKQLLEEEGLALARVAARAAESGPLGVQVIREIGEVDGLAFAVIEGGEGVMAMSRKAWDTPFPHEDPFIDALLASGEAASRLVEVEFPDRGMEEILEAVVPLRLAEGRKGIVRVGLETRHLAEARTELRRTLILRSGLFLVLGLSFISFFSMASSRRVLAREGKRLRAEILKYEEEKGRSERLSAMGELAGGVAHEIRNPLNTLRMLGQRLEREFEPREDADEYRRLTSTAISEVDRIARIVNGFLGFARPAATKKIAGDLSAKLQSISSTFRLQTEGRGAILRSSVKEGLRLEFDPDLIDQAVLNLLVNALDAAGEGGTICLDARRQGAEILISVSDDGAGIPEANRVRIWDLYFSTKENGTGMGLPSVHRIVSEHGGRIEMSSAVGTGTRFEIRFPLNLS